MLDSLLKKDLIPDGLLSFGIRYLLKDRLKSERQGNAAAVLERQRAYAENLKAMPLAIHETLANEQHYEVPTAFYQLVLGPNLKYSSGLWDQAKDLAGSEEDMLQLVCERMQLKDGQKVLDLGCGWGSMALYMAKHFPNCKITAVSNSHTQKAFIDREAKNRNFKNVEVITQNVVKLDFDFKSNAEKFDRIVSVEMFEHLKNYQLLFSRLSRWLKPDGKVFVHIFTHKELSYAFEVKDSTDWMSKYFFSGGMMPSDKLFYSFQDDLLIKEHWTVDGTHYQRTSLAWLANMDKNKKKVLEIFRQTYGEKEALKWWSYWRIFFLSCAELWGYKKGTEWMVSHYLFEQKVS